MFKSVLLFCVLLVVTSAEYLHSGYGDYGLYGGHEYGVGGYGYGVGGHGSGLYSGHGLHGYGYGYATPLATSYSSRIDYPTKHVPVVSSYVAPVVAKPVVVAPLTYGHHGYGSGLYGGGLDHAYGGYSSGYGYPYSGYGYDGHHEYKKK